MGVYAQLETSPQHARRIPSLGSTSLQKEWEWGHWHSCQDKLPHLQNFLCQPSYCQPMIYICCWMYWPMLVSSNTFPRPHGLRKIKKHKEYSPFDPKLKHFVEVDILLNLSPLTTVYHHLYKFSWHLIELISLNHNLAHVRLYVLNRWYKYFILIDKFLRIFMRWMGFFC